MTSNPNSSDFNYKDYSLEKLQEWVHDAMNGDASPHEIYSAIREAVREEYYYHKDRMSHTSGLLELLSGHRPMKDEPYDGWDYTATGEKFPRVCDRDNPSPECKKDWVDFWEEAYYPEEHKQYTEEELNAMCDKAASDQEKDKCREYNLREAEYYNQRAKLDAEYEAIKAAGGYEWTPDPQVSRNDETRLKYEDGWVYESPDGGKTVTKRKVGSTEKIVVKEDKPKKWILPVEEVRDEDTGKDEYCVTFPDDLLESANLKEGDEVEWVDQGDGSYLLRKVSRPLRMDEC